LSTLDCDSNSSFSSPGRSSVAWASYEPRYSFQDAALLLRNGHEEPWGGSLPEPDLAVELNIHGHTMANAQRNPSAARGQAVGKRGNAGGGSRGTTLLQVKSIRVRPKVGPSIHLGRLLKSLIEDGRDVPAQQDGPASAANYARTYTRPSSNSARSCGRENMGQWPVGSSTECTTPAATPGRLRRGRPGRLHRPLGHLLP
jgi:hypothetical protein